MSQKFLLHTLHTLKNYIILYVNICENKVETLGTTPFLNYYCVHVYFRKKKVEEKLHCARKIVFWHFFLLRYIHYTCFSWINQEKLFHFHDNNHDDIKNYMLHIYLWGIPTYGLINSLIHTWCCNIIKC